MGLIKYKTAWLSFDFVQVRNSQAWGWSSLKPPECLRILFMSKNPKLSWGGWSLKPPSFLGILFKYEPPDCLRILFKSKNPKLSWDWWSLKPPWTLSGLIKSETARLSCGVRGQHAKISAATFTSLLLLAVQALFSLCVSALGRSWFHSESV